MLKKTISPNKLKQSLFVQNDYSDEDLKAALAVNPVNQAIVTLQTYGSSWGNLDLGGLIKALESQVIAVQENNLSNSEAMLTAQAYTLDAIFHKLAQMAAEGGHNKRMDALLKMALRAQSQCRMTWEAICANKSPSVVYAKQANIANGHQQVNNT